LLSPQLATREDEVQQLTQRIAEYDEHIAVRCKTRQCWSAHAPDSTEPSLLSSVNMQLGIASSR